MKISLRKVGRNPLDFELESKKITFKGYLQYDSDKLVLLKAKLYGQIEADCDICAAEFELDVDEDVEFFVSEGVYEKREDSLIDVVEVFDHTLDIQEVLDSEIQLIKSDYISCKSCQTGSACLAF